MVDGKKFGPSPKKEWYYQPADYHNPVKVLKKKGHKAKETEHADKSHWALNKSNQYDVFLEGELNDFIDSNGIFSLLDNCNEILGQDGERLAIFETPSNCIDPWHGYPFFSKDEDKLTDDMIDKFKEKGKVSVANYSRLLSRKI